MEIHQIQHKYGILPVFYRTLIEHTNEIRVSK